MDPEKAKELPKPVKKFYKGEPLALGITQILIGIIGILFGITLNVANVRYELIYVIVMIPYWTGILFIISGSLSVAASRNPKPSLTQPLLTWRILTWHNAACLSAHHLLCAAVGVRRRHKVKGMLGMNTVSAVAAGIAIIFLGISLPHSQWHVMYRCTPHYGSSEIDPLCYENEIIPNNIRVGVMSVLLLLASLEFCVSISTAAFGCKTVCLESYTETVVVLYQNVSPENAFSLQATREVPTTLGDKLSEGGTSTAHDYGNLGNF